MDQAEAQQDISHQWIDPDFAEAIADPLRFKIMGELTLETMSAKQFADKFPKFTYSMVHKAFRKLDELGCIELVATKSGGSRRSAKERFFRTTRRAFFGQETWAKFPLHVRECASAVTFENFFGRVSDAIQSGTMDSRTDRHASWTPLQLDQRAWEDVVADLAAFFASLTVRQAEASARLLESQEVSIQATVGLACFESPSHRP